MLEEQCTFLQG